MTTHKLLATARTPGQDLYGRIELVQRLIEGFVAEAIKIPVELNFKQVMMLARMAKDPDDMVVVGSLLSKGFYAGSNVSYNLKQLVENGFVTIQTIEGDRRRKYVKLTRAGREFGLKVATQVDFVEREIGKVFSEDQYRRARQFLAETIFGGEATRPVSEDA